MRADGFVSKLDVTRATYYKAYEPARTRLDKWQLPILGNRMNERTAASLSETTEKCDLR